MRIFFVSSCATLNVPVPDDVSSFERATELIDWVRFIDPPLGRNNTIRVVSLLVRWDTSEDCLAEMVMFLEPGETLLDSLKSTNALSRILTRQYVFHLSVVSPLVLTALIRSVIHWALFLCSPQDIKDPVFRSELVHTLTRLTDKGSAISYSRLFLTLLARPCINSGSETGESLFLFLSALMRQLKESPFIERLKRVLFVESVEMKFLLHDKSFVSSGSFSPKRNGLPYVSIPLPF